MIFMTFSKQPMLQLSNNEKRNKLNTTGEKKSKKNFMYAYMV